MLSPIAIRYILCKCEACEPGHVAWYNSLGSGKIGQSRAQGEDRSV